MAIIPMSEMLADAQQNRYAVGCFNAINSDMIRGILQAAEQEKAPVILCHAEIHLPYAPLASLAPMLVSEARRARVPVAILLDHGHTFDVLMQAMKLGFNAVMYDGSSLAYEENLANTREMVRIAHAMDVEIEAELGHVTRPKSAGAGGSESDDVIDDASLYTNPQQAQEFVAETGVHALAVAFGTAHGVYLKKPVLDLERLAAIHARADVPLVMHGGSGLSEQDFHSAIRNGVSKINYYTGMAAYAAEQVRTLTQGEKRIFAHDVMMTAIQAYRDDAARALRLFGSAGRA